MRTQVYDMPHGPALIVQHPSSPQPELLATWPSARQLTGLECVVCGHLTSEHVKGGDFVDCKTLQRRDARQQHLRTLAGMLAIADHAEQWDTSVTIPLSEAQMDYYLPLAERAVRECSEVDEAGARGMAGTWAVSAFAALADAVSSKNPDATPKHREYLIRHFIGMAMDVRAHAMSNGFAGPHHPAYRVVIEAGAMEGDE